MPWSRSGIPERSRQWCYSIPAATSGRGLPRRKTDRSRRSSGRESRDRAVVPRRRFPQVRLRSRSMRRVPCTTYRRAGSEARTGVREIGLRAGPVDAVVLADCRPSHRSRRRGLLVECPQQRPRRHRRRVARCPRRLGSRPARPPTTDCWMTWPCSTVRPSPPPTSIRVCATSTSTRRRGGWRWSQWSTAFAPGGEFIARGWGRRVQQLALPMRPLAVSRGMASDVRIVEDRRVIESGPRGCARCGQTDPRCTAASIASPRCLTRSTARAGGISARKRKCAGFFDTAQRSRRLFLAAFAVHRLRRRRCLRGSALR